MTEDEALEEALVVAQAMSKALTSMTLHRLTAANQEMANGAVLMIAAFDALTAYRTEKRKWVPTEEEKREIRRLHDAARERGEI